MTTRSYRQGSFYAHCVRIDEGLSPTTGRPYVIFKWEISEEGVYKGKVISDFKYPPCEGRSEQAAQIFNKQLKSLMTICGCPDELRSYDDLMMKTLVINNKPEKRDDGTMQNRINYYLRDKKKKGGAGAVAPVAVSPVTTAPVAAAPPAQAAPAAVAPVAAGIAPAAAPAAFAPQGVAAPAAAPPAAMVQQAPVAAAPETVVSQMVAQVPATAAADQIEEDLPF